MNSILKVCTKCKSEKPIDQFRKWKPSRDGRRSVCKSCQSTNKKRYDAKSRGMRLCKKCQRVLDPVNFRIHGNYHGSYCLECDRSDSYNEELKLRASNHKKCRSCNKTRHFSEFSKSNRNVDGHYSYCKNCESIRSKEKYRKNKKRIDAKNKRNYEKNKEYYREKHKEWYNDNPDYSRHRAIRRRALERSAEGSYTKEEFDNMCNKYGNVCLKCKKAKKLTVDHVIPLSKGGNNYISNIQPLCLTCNRAKGTKSTDYRP